MRKLVCSGLYGEHVEKSRSVLYRANFEYVIRVTVLGKSSCVGELREPGCQVDALKVSEPTQWARFLNVLGMALRSSGQH